MKHLTLSILCLFFVCTDAIAQTPEEFNKNLNEIIDSVHHYNEVWSNILAQSLETGNWNDLESPYQKLDSYLSSGIERLKKMKDVNNSGSLRTTTIEFLLYEQSVVTKGFSVFNNFSKSTPQDSITKAFTELLQLNKSEGAYIEKLWQLQDKYFEENGIKPQH